MLGLSTKTAKGRLVFVTIPGNSPRPISNAFISLELLPHSTKGADGATIAKFNESKKLKSVPLLHTVSLYPASSIKTPSKIRRLQLSSTPVKVQFN